LLAGISLLFGLNLLRAEELVAASPAKPDLDGWSVEAAARLGATIRDLSPDGDGPYPQRIVAPGDGALVSGSSGIYLHSENDLDYPDFVLLPGQAPLLYVLVNPPASVETLGPQVERFPERSLQYPNNIRVEFVRVRPYSRESALALPQVAVNWPSDAGLTMLGYSVNPMVRPGQPIDFTVYWRVDELSPQRSGWYPVFFYHLEDLSGSLLANVGKHGRWGYRWQPGDVYVERMGIMPPENTPPGAYHVRISLFDPIHNHLFRLHSPDGPTDAVTVPISIEQPAD